MDPPRVVSRHSKTEDRPMQGRGQLHDPRPLRPLLLQVTGTSGLGRTIPPGQDGAGPPGVRLSVGAFPSTDPER